MTWCGPSADPSTFCRSARVGKYLVMKLLGRDSPTLWSRRRFVATTMLVDGDRASVLGRLTGTKRASGHAISYRIAHFIQFRDEKVIDYVSIIDSFDASNNCWATILMRMTAIGSRATSSRCSRG